MKRFPYKLIFLGIFLPPVCYILTLQILEGYFQKRETARLNQLLIQNDKALYEGQYRIQEEIRRNIENYLRENLKYRLGVRTNILVKTGSDRILYPVQWQNGFKDSSGEGSFSEIPEPALNFVEVAQENYRILNEGLALSVSVRIRHNSWISNGILCFYIFVAVLVLQRAVKKRVREAEKHEEAQEQEILRLSEQLNQRESRLREISAKENDYLTRIEALSREKNTLSRDMDEILDEMEQLETGLKDETALKDQLETEAQQLKEEMNRLRGRLHKSKKKKKRLESVQKRFSVLYKNLTFTDRAVEGFLALTEDFQLKAEEVIHRLNADESQISVKRKVFGKGGKMNVLEVDFAYSGRIYFQRDSQPGLKILVIGTKNTQDQDLAFLERVT